jgi:EAL domain-containing protein (putative c-di-GMP-specific phosphodiesterase class I)
MDFRPVLKASDQVLAAVEVREADAGAALAQLAVWDHQALRVPRVIVGVAGPPDAQRIEGELAAHGIAGDRLALAFPEAWLEANGMRESLSQLRSRTGAVAIVADFGSGSHPDVEYLVDYPADALALSARLVEGIGAEDGAERIREICEVAAGLGWSVVAAEVGTSEERRALAIAGVDEVAGPGIAPFESAAGLGPLLSRLKVSIPAAPDPSRRAPQPASQPRIAAPATAPAAPAERRPAPAAASGSEQRSPWSRERGVRRDPAVSSRLRRPEGNRASALPSAARGSPGRSQPPRRDPADRGRRGPSPFLIVLALLLLAAIAYVVLAYLGHVPDPLGIEDIEISI